MDLMGAYIPLIVLGVLLIAGIVSGIIWKIRMSRAEARRWATPK